MPIRPAKPPRAAHDAKVLSVGCVLGPIAGPHFGKRSDATCISATVTRPRIQLTVVASKTACLKVPKGFVCLAV